MLHNVLIDSELLRPDHRSFDVLIASLRASKTWQPSTELFAFLDECILRCGRKPVHYHDKLKNILGPLKNNKQVVTHTAVDLVLITILEQWAFFQGSVSEAAVTNVASWLVRYLELSLASGANISALSHIRDLLEAEASGRPCCTLFQDALNSPVKNESSHEKNGGHQAQLRSGANKRSSAIQADETTTPIAQASIFSGPPEEDENLTGLTTLRHIEVKEIVLGGAAEKLMLSLCSKHEELRLQALIALRKLLAQLQASLVITYLPIANPSRSLTTQIVNCFTFSLENWWTLPRTWCQSNHYPILQGSLLLDFYQSSISLYIFYMKRSISFSARNRVGIRPNCRPTG